MSIFSGLDFLLLVPHFKCPKSLQNGVATHIIVHGSEQWIGFKLPMWRYLRKDHQRPPTVHPVSSRRLSTWTNGLEKPSIWVQCDNQLRRWTSPLQEGRPVQAPPTEPNLSTDQVSLTEISRLGPFNPQGSWAFFHPTKTAWASAGFCWVLFLIILSTNSSSTKKNLENLFERTWFWKLHLQWWPSMTNLRAIDTLCTSGSHTGFNNLGGSSRSLGTVPNWFLREESK